MTLIYGLALITSMKLAVRISGEISATAIRRFGVIAAADIARRIRERASGFTDFRASYPKQEDFNAARDLRQVQLRSTEP